MLAPMVFKVAPTGSHIQIALPICRGRRFHRPTEEIPRHPWKSKSPYAFRHTNISINTGMQGVHSGTMGYLFHRSGPVRDTPPIAQYLFEIVSQRGVSHSFAYRWDTPFGGGGGIAPPLRMLSTGETLRQGEGVSHPIGHVEAPKTP